MDQLRIKDLEIYAHHGVFAAEKELGQRFILDVCLEYDMTQAARYGDLSASVHYGELAEQLTIWCQENKEDLLETLAYQLIGRIFSRYPLVEKIALEVKKPWAPIPFPLETCSVKLERHKYRAFIGLGSNQGDKETYLDEALKCLEKEGVVLLQASSRIETEPWGGVKQASFLNQVIEIETWQTPHELLQLLLKIEKEMGRVRDIKWGPRVIDLDILYMEKEQLYSQDLIVPHPYVAERAFVLESLVEIAPHFIDPQRKKSIRQLWAEVKEQDIS